MAAQQESFEGVDWYALKDREVDWKKQEDVPPIYTNVVAVTVSVNDFVLGLGLVEEATKDRFVVKEQLKVIMSPQHAKALTDVLTEKVRSYERTFGKIPSLPADARGGS